ncbi:MAG: hypothetical protein ACOYOZ_17650, partial [Pirellula sp.]
GLEGVGEFSREQNSNWHSKRISLRASSNAGANQPCGADKNEHEGIAVDAGSAGRGRGLSAGFEHRDAFFCWTRL